MTQNEIQRRNDCVTASPLRMSRLPTGAALRQGTGEVPCPASAAHLQKTHSQVYSDL